MGVRNQVETELENQWKEEYLVELHNLENPPVENPLDWYNRVGKRPVKDDVGNNSEQAVRELAEMPMHVLYRVFPVRSQKIALVGHNPKDKTKELETGSGELYELAQIEMDPGAIGEITGPRIAKYYQKYVERDEPLTDVVLEALRNDGHINYESISHYFKGNKNNLPPVFEDIYITNLMKLPTRTGLGVDEFDSNFYNDLLWRELTALSPELVFVQGRPAWKAIRKWKKKTEITPLDGAPDTTNIKEVHGHSYDVGGMIIVPLVHPSARKNSKKRYAETHDILEKSISRAEI